VFDYVLGQTKTERKMRYFSIEADNAIEIADRIDTSSFTHSPRKRTLSAVALSSPPFRGPEFASGIMRDTRAPRGRVVDTILAALCDLGSSHERRWGFLLGCRKEFVDERIWEPPRACDGVEPLLQVRDLAPLDKLAGIQFLPDDYGGD
jgi:hypothetical protein